METTSQPTRPTWEHRLQAVLALLGGEPVPHVTARFGMGLKVPTEMAPPRTHGPPGGADGSPPRAAVSRQSALARAGTTARGAGPASSDLECGADPCQGWPGSAITPAPSNACATAMRCHACPNGRSPAGPPDASRGR